MNAYSYMTILKKKIKIKVYNKDSLGSLILVSEYFYRLDEWHRIRVYIDDIKDRDRIVCSNLLRYIESLVNLKLCQSNASTLCISHPKIIFFTLMLRIFSAIEIIKPWLQNCNLDVNTFHLSFIIACVENFLLAELSFCRIYYLWLVKSKKMFHKKIYFWFCSFFIDQLIKIGLTNIDIHFYPVLG